MKFEICVKVEREFRIVELDNIQMIFFGTPQTIFDTIYTDKVRIYLNKKSIVEFEFGGTENKPTWITLTIK